MCRGKGYVGTLFFSLKFAVNLKNCLKKKKEGRKKHNQMSVLWVKGGTHLKL